MSVNANAMTLSDYALLSNDDQIRSLAYAMIKAGSVFRDLPAVTRRRLTIQEARYTTLPGLRWRSLNTDNDPARPTVPQHYSEQMFLLQDSRDFDEYFLMDEAAIRNPVQAEGEVMMKALTYELNDAFINNTHVDRPNRSRAKNQDCFVGIRERLDDAQYGLLIEDLKVASSVTLASPTGSAANAMIAEMQARLDAMGEPEGDGVAILAADEFIRKLEQGLRDLGPGGGFRYDQDAFGRNVTMYRNAKIHRIGRRIPTESSGTISQPYIITSTETPDGNSDTGGSSTSVYFVKMGLSSLHAWQFHPPKLEPVYRLDNGIIERLQIKAAYGLNSPDNRAAARIYGIAMA